MQTGATRAARRTPVIGFLAARFDEAYQHAVWGGAAVEAELLCASLVFFGGQRIGSPIGFEALDNIAFDLAGRSDIAGLIVMSNVIGTYISNEEQLAFLRRFRGMELVTIGVEYPGVACVCVDSSGGMRSIAEHLVRAHERRRFLFIAGPRGHRESEARAAEFLSSLEILLPGTEPDIIYSDFTDEDARNKVSLYLDSKTKDETMIDAVVAANDHMAFGALGALTAFGLDVPREVSLTGFDDTEDSRFSTPPLTTVRQPAATLGRLAVRRMAVKLGLVPEEAQASLAVSFVIRESCGCRYAPEQDSLPSEDAKPLEGIEPVAAAVKREIHAGRNPGRLRKRPMPSDLKDKALLTIAEGECRFLAARQLLAERRTTILREIESSLVSSFAMEDILREIARGIRELGISACWLCLFESKGPSPEWSKLFLTADASKVGILSPQGIRFRTAELVPGGLPLAWSAYVCEPLRFGDDRLGYLICTADSTDRRMYVALRDQVSGAVKGAMLMAAERDREKDLERKVRSRTLQLSTANWRLVEEMERRKRLERELLDISNLIMGDIGRDIHDDLCQDIAVLGIMAAVLKGKLERAGLPAEGGAAAEIASRAGKTAAKAKSMARGLYPVELEAKGIVPAVESLVAAARKDKDVRVRLDVTEGFTVHDPQKAIHLFRIVQEALGNAIKHSKAKEILVGLYMDRENITVEVGDNGIGIPHGALEEGGMGLQIMKYRASVIRGELRIRSLDSGASVSCRVAR
ncbi:MAG: substrate-binding domain-containing protein [Spirochaetes bacterium]|nr:substrate-binding domain-containing protein [Spirochaetota bacterium]